MVLLEEKKYLPISYVSVSIGVMAEQAVAT